jgi:hypothetical protein
VLILAMSIGRCLARLLSVPSGNSLPVTVPLTHILPSWTVSTARRGPIRAEGRLSPIDTSSRDLTCRASRPVSRSATLVSTKGRGLSLGLRWDR